MPRPLSTAATAVALLATLLAPGARAAEDDEPIPYPDEEEEQPRTRPRERPRRSEPTYIAPEETDVEKQDREMSLAMEDDPNTGLAGELISGAMLVDSSRGGLDPRFSWGLRFTWEAGRYLPGDTFRESLFADVSWTYMGMRDGTQSVYGDSNYHYFTVAPAWGFPFWTGSDFSFYAQVGGGLAYQYSVLHAGPQTALPISGVKPVIQYGVGVRGRPLIPFFGEDGVLRLSFRVELTRFRRHYMDDTFLGGSVGLAY
jgi:hypothetical protein